MSTMVPSLTASFTDATASEIEEGVQQAATAFNVYRKLSLSQRANFMNAIADGLESARQELTEVAHSETQLPDARLQAELTRTIFQLRSYAGAAGRGLHLDVRIDLKPGKTDLRKMMVPLGPVVVFGAANFPFAYSTAGGDTASALAAGCTVIVKAHPAHARTGELVAAVIRNAAAIYHLPEGVFVHLHGAASRVGQTLVEHDAVRAVGFTGSFAGGRQLFDWASQRKVPIPLFAEMSSINPVFILPRKLSSELASVADQLADSITLGVGQFCTNPGLLVALDNADTSSFISRLEERITNTAPGEMLNPGIFKNYVERRANALAQPEVSIAAVANASPLVNQGAPTIAVTDSASFINNPLLHQEVFGPYSLLVKCRDENEMLAVALHLEGQLTSTLMATEDDLDQNRELVETLKYNCGRLILNNVPTGVEVSLGMQHGGPYPATTDSRFTSVGADAIRRFVRPVTYQNWPDHLLPPELANANSTGIWRTINDRPTLEDVS